MSYRIPHTFEMVPGSTWTYEHDFGENTDGSETGILNDGDTVASIVLSIATKPTDADNPTLGTPSIGADTRYICGRQCSAGEWAKWTIATAADQDVGRYDIKIAVTTTNSNVVILYQDFYVVSGTS